MGDSNSQLALRLNATATDAPPWTPAELAQHLVDWITANDNAGPGGVDWAALLPPLTAEQSDAIAAHLKSLADQVRQSDLARAGKVVDLLFIWAAITANPFHRALALRAKGNLQGLGQGKFREAITAYDEAGQLYRHHERPVEWAQTQIGKIEALANLGQWREALALGEEALQLLLNHQQWLPATYMASNLAFCILLRRGENKEALAMFTRALTFYQRSGSTDNYTLAAIEQNRGVLLRDMGRFEEALQANMTARESLRNLGYTIEAARTHQNIGETFALSGRYNEAIKHVSEARQTFLQDQRLRDVVDAERVLRNCLLHLRRFQEVLTLCTAMRAMADQVDAQFHLAEAMLQEASAYVGLGNYGEAIAALQAARQLCLALDHQVWAARADLYEALLLYRQHEYGRSLLLAQQAIAVMQRHEQPMAEAQAQLAAAQAALALQQYSQAHQLIQSALVIAYGKDAPYLLYEGHYMQGKLAQATGAPERALAAYAQAIQQLERLQGHLMVEHRPDFAADKQVVYEEIVTLYLAQGQPVRAFEYTERAKSRALLDLVAWGVDLSIAAKDPADQHIVEALTHLRIEQNRLYRSWEGRNAGRQSKELQGALPAADQPDWQPLWQEIRNLEQQIAALWSQLLVRNADYAREAALWQVRTENIQPDLADDTLLLEYFFTQERLLLFAVTTATINVYTLPCTRSQVESTLRFLQMNFSLAMRGATDDELVVEAQDLLQELYEQLLAPVQSQLAAYQQLVIVPHSFLHKLPFHALYDGAAYLMERHTVCYLPSASLLRYCRPAQPVRAAAQPLPAERVAFGYSWSGYLPAAATEAATVAHLVNGVAYTEARATRTTFQQVAATATLLHLATHGEFRADDPLYSYLLLADGRLTTLDIFNLRLRASLVTLSACDTGQSLIGGGDELLGLLRAFLYAGAASVIVSYWRVADAATHGLMSLFYQQLMTGTGKAAALRNAQQQWAATAVTRLHPYTWASFFLVGDPGAF